MVGKKRQRVSAILLFSLVIILFALTWVPGVIRVNTAEGSFDCSYYSSVFMGNNVYNVLSGLLLGGSMIPLIIFIRFSTVKPITFAAIMLEMAALLGFSQIIYTYLTPPGVYTPLSHAVETGTCVAAVFAFFLYKRTQFERKATILSMKQMVLCFLIVSAVFVLTFIKRCWRWDWPDQIAYVHYYDGAGNWGCFFSGVLMASVLNIILLNIIGLISSDSLGCAFQLLVAATLTIINILLHFVSSDAAFIKCTPLFLTYMIAIIQIAVGVYLLVKRRKPTNMET